VPEPVEAEMEEEEETLHLLLERVLEIASLDGVKVFLFSERQEKRHVLSCPLALYKCSMDIRAPQDPTVGNRAMIVVPSLRRNPVLGEVREKGNLANQNINISMNRPTNIIIWNIRGGNNDNFRRNFRKMVDTHRPCVVALLETRMGNHLELLDDYNFTEFIEVPAEGQAGGIVVLYNHQIVTVQNFVRRDQEIHATIEVIPIRQKWMFSAIYAGTNILLCNKMWDRIESISNSYNGPCLFGGYFNDILCSNEKFGGNNIHDSRAKCLWSKINNYNLIDLGYKGCKYTWSNL